MYEIFTSGPAETNSILFYTESSSEAILFDAPLGCTDHWDARLKKLGKTASTLLLTHSHWDHIADVAAMKKRWGISVGVHKEDAGNLQQPGSDQLPLWFAIEAADPDFFVTEGEKLHVGDVAIEVLHTPGHSPGCVCYYLPEHKIVISGDTLFQGTIGNLSFATGRPHLIKGSLAKLLQLPHDTLVIPGHGETTTIGDEQDIVQRMF